MNEIMLTQVDAFADRVFSGNPAAVVRLAAWLPEDLLQSIAMENNLPATAFAVPSPRAHVDYELRWFTPVTEIAMCGHATLAAAHVLMGEREQITFWGSAVGPIPVNRVGCEYELDLPALKAERHDLPDVVNAIGCRAVETFRHASEFALVLLENEASVRSVLPDFRALAATDYPVVIVSAIGSEADLVSRVFAPAEGVDEDQVCASAHTLLVPFWAERLGRNCLTAHQASRRGGRFACRLIGERVLLRGPCIKVMEGVLRIT